MTTTKKMKVCGTEEYMNTRTGQIETFNVVSIEEKDANFNKIWLGHILNAIDEIGNAKMKILMHLISKRHPATNMLVETYAEIAKATKTSTRTVITTVQKLIEHEIVIRKRGTRGVLFLNPNVVFKGTVGNRMKVLIEYKEWEQLSLPLENEEREAA